MQVLRDLPLPVHEERAFASVAGLTLEHGAGTSRFNLGIPAMPCMSMCLPMGTICKFRAAYILVADPFVAQFLGGIDVNSLTEDRSKRELLRVSNIRSAAQQQSSIAENQLAGVKHMRRHSSVKKAYASHVVAECTGISTNNLYSI